MIMKRLDYLLEKNNVIGYSEEEEHIEVLVTEKLTKEKLRELIDDASTDWTENDVVPEEYRSLFSSKPFKVVQIGEVTTENSKKYRPILEGCEINPNKTFFMGTGGGMCYKYFYRQLELRGKWKSFRRILDRFNIPYEKKAYLLTNTHVTHPTDVENPTNKIFIRQPSRGGGIGFTSGDSTAYKGSGYNYNDASLIDLDVPYKEETINGKSRNGINTVPYRSLKLWKYGRTTDYTEGKIKNLGATVRVKHGDKKYIFKNIILCSNMSASGDSGSLVYDTDDQIVGLLFAGSNTTTMVIPITQVIKDLGVEFE